MFARSLIARSLICAATFAGVAAAVPTVASAAPLPLCKITGTPGDWSVTLHSNGQDCGRWRTEAFCGSQDWQTVYGGWHGDDASSEARCYTGEVNKYGYEQYGKFVKLGGY